jgi:hypothetical protein
VSQPFTDYTRYEFAAYSDNIAAGEKVRVVPRAALAADDQRWASEDFWIFDDELVALLSYDEEGRFLGAQQAEDTTPYLDAKQSAEHRHRLRGLRHGPRTLKTARLAAAPSTR